MAMRASKIDLSTAKQLHNAMALYCRATKFKEDVVSQISGLNTSEQIPSLVNPAKPNEVISARVSLNPATSTCPATNVKLKATLFDTKKRNELFEDILDVSTKIHAKSFKGNTERARSELLKFVEWFQ